MSDLKKRNPFFWIPSTWFAMGLPFVALATSAAIMYKSMGVSDTQIAIWTSVIMWPWTFKPLWSPFMELYKTKKFFVVSTQILTGVLFGLVALSLHLSAFFAVSIAVLQIIAISGATHDIAADGVYLNELNSREQAKYAGWQGAFYNVAKIVAGGVLVYFAGTLEKSVGITQAWVIIMFVFGGIMVLMGVYNSKVLPTGGKAIRKESSKEIAKTLRDVFVTFFQKKNIWAGLLFIIFYRFAEGHAIKIAPLFLKAARTDGGLGLSTDQIGFLYGTIGAIAFVLGSILSGYYVSRKGLSRRTLLTLCAVFNLPFAVYAFLAWLQPQNMYAIGIAVGFEYFGYGFGFIGLILFIMQNIAPGKYKMAHYAFGGGIMNLGFMIPSMLSGVISDYLGYKDFFIWVLICTIPAFVVSWFVPLKSKSEIDALDHDEPVNHNDLTLSTDMNGKE
jgi:PAT family beta-lactamase induction signal transducer AmpG